MLLLLVVLALSASPAEAATLSFGSGAYTYTGTAGDDTITIAGEFVFTDPAGIDVQGGAVSRCTADGPEVTCSAASTLAADLAGGADRLTVTGTDAAVEADGGPGADMITGSDGDDTFIGGEGADVLDGGDGLEVFSAGSGDDTVIGGAGDDFLFGDEGDDTLTGGAGEDAIDGDEDDDTVRAGPENDDINGWGGIDEIGYDEPEREAGVVVDLSTEAGTDGGPGETGEDAIAFEDVVGSRFADRLTGDARENALAAGAGDDLIESADGLAEDVDCGDGFDLADADPVDRLTGCEPKVVPTPTPTPTPTPESDPAPAPLPAPPAPAPVTSTPIVGTSIAVRRGRITRLTLRDIPAGGQVKIFCKPRCRTVRRAYPDGLSRVDFSFRLPVGTLLTIRVTQPGAIGRARFVRIRRTSIRSASVCLAPGTTRSIACR
jgi:Ca2+-binding RTX toxin-like protein